jgi:hypothetical protein
MANLSDAGRRLVYRSPVLLFLSGWPACGMHYYGEWLATHHDFRHLDLECLPSQRSELHALWEKSVPARASALAERLLKMHPRWVVTAKAPTDGPAQLEPLQAAGFDLWFLLPRTDAVSRQQWLVHEKEKNPEARGSGWDQQADAIRKAARGLRPYFRDRCVQTLSGVGELMDGDALAARMGIVK